MSVFGRHLRTSAGRWTHFRFARESGHSAARLAYRDLFDRLVRAGRRLEFLGIPLDRICKGPTICDSCRQPINLEPQHV